MISSVHNPKVQAVHKLLTQAKERKEQKAFVVEGVRLAEEALQAGWLARQVFYTDQLDERGRGIVQAYSARGTAVEQLSERVMSSLSETETAQGLMVMMEQQTLPVPTNPDFLLILDKLRDPGNLGTVLRTAAAARVQGVLLSPGCAEAWSGKVLRAGMGAHFRLPIHSMGWNEIKKLIKHSPGRAKVYLADAKGGVAYTQANFRVPLALIMGGEASGAGDEALALADEKVHIPMPGGSESLNAAIATGILLFEVLRQRGGEKAD